VIEIWMSGHSAPARDAARSAVKAAHALVSPDGQSFVLHRSRSSPRAADQGHPELATRQVKPIR
jgi:hypothetical protein